MSGPDARSSLSRSLSLRASPPRFARPGRAPCGAPPAGRALQHRAPWPYERCEAFRTRSVAGRDGRRGGGRPSKTPETSQITSANPHTRALARIHTQTHTRTHAHLARRFGSGPGSLCCSRDRCCFAVASSSSAAAAAAAAAAAVGVGCLVLSCPARSHKGPLRQPPVLCPDPPSSHRLLLCGRPRLEPYTLWPSGWLLLLFSLSCPRLVSCSLLFSFPALFSLP